MRALNAIEPICHLLASRNALVKSRIVGTLHNLSSDFAVVANIRQCGAIPNLVTILSMENTSNDNDQQSEDVLAAAGCIQNISREDQSRQIIKDSGAIIALAQLLMSNDTQAQACAAGAILNVRNFFHQIFH